MPDTDTCRIEGCDRVRYGQKGICEAHYRRQRRTGRLDENRPIGATEPIPCMVDRCRNVSTERGLCHGHYLRLIRLGDVQADQPLGRRRNHTCEVDRCERTARGRGLCATHLARQRETGDPQANVAIREVSGTGYIHHGYQVVPIPRADRWLVGGRTSELEHRYVMAKMLGRPLTADESVHHRDGDRLRNDPENLELWSRWQPSGQRVADKLLAALELVERYAPELLAGSARNEPEGPVGRVDKGLSQLDTA